MKTNQRKSPPPRILFIGLPDSSHTHSWIDLLKDSSFEIRFFSTVPGYPPADWWVPCYLISPAQSNDTLSVQRFHLYDALEKQFISINRIWHKAFWFSIRAFRKIINWIGARLGIPPLDLVLPAEDSLSAFQPWKISFSNQIPHPALRREHAQKWLAQIIRDWQPDIIHTLGIFNNQGGEFYLNTRNQYPIDKIGKWIATARGGPDLALYKNMESHQQVLKWIIAKCDVFIADNDENYHNAIELGLDPQKASSLGAVPGTGGIDIQTLSAEIVLPPSERERLILWPKAYECPQSKALPVLEAIRLAWNSIQPAQIILTAITFEVEMWLKTLPVEIQASCTILQRIPRADLIKWIAKSRITLIPSLSDGIPNTLYEAMACGSFPIVSPIQTITNIVKNEENVLFARNLYPQEIAEALTRAMNEDQLVDIVAQNNRSLVAKLADRSRIKKNVINFYHDLLLS